MVVGVLAGEEGRAGGAAERIGDVAVAEARAVGGEQAERVAHHDRSVTFMSSVSITTTFGRFCRAFSRAQQREPLLLRLPGGLAGPIAPDGGVRARGGPQNAAERSGADDGEREPRPQCSPGDHSELKPATP